MAIEVSSADVGRVAPQAGSVGAALAAAVDMRREQVALTVMNPGDGYFQTLLKANPSMPNETASELASLTKQATDPTTLKSGNRDVLSVGDKLVLPPAPYGDAKVQNDAAGKSGDAHYQELEDKQRLAEKGGAQLSEADRADLAGYQKFPANADSKYRDLASREFLSIDNAGPALTTEQNADLASKRQFPADADSKYRDLARQEALSIDGGPKLSEDERADLGSKRQFPDDADSRYRDLARRESLSTDHAGPELSRDESADLASKRQFPNPKDSYYRGLARTELLSESGGPKLTPDETNTLAYERVLRNQ